MEDKADLLSSAAIQVVVGRHVQVLDHKQDRAFLHGMLWFFIAFQLAELSKSAITFCLYQGSHKNLRSLRCQHIEENFIKRLVVIAGQSLGMFNKFLHSQLHG